MNVFKLPDLGEGLTEAEIVSWRVRLGDTIEAGQDLMAVETAKAIVDIPSPVSGVVRHLFAQPGDVVHIGDPLVEFDTGGEPVRDAGTVVGQVAVKQTTIRESGTAQRASPAGGYRATPAVRAMAHRLNVDLASVTPTGPDNTITASDIQRVAKVLVEAGPLEPLRGTRRAMAQTLALAHAQVVPVTICEDADIGAWATGADLTVRLIRAIVAGCAAEPSLNAWYDAHALGRRVLRKIDLGMAVDTDDGLFVPVLRDVGNRNAASLRDGLNTLKRAVKARTIPPDELRGYTITLSNFGTVAGRYANPVVVPPTVAILGAGAKRSAGVAVDDKVVVRPILPLSLTFDHRAVTGGEAARFLAAVIQDLKKAE